MKHPSVSVVVLLAFYFPLSYWARVAYVPDSNSPPPSAGIRVRIVQPYEHVTPISVAIQRAGVFETLDVTRVELWEDNHKVGPANSTVSEIGLLGSGRFLLEKTGRITWSSSDNTDPTTNRRTYWIVNP